MAMIDGGVVCIGKFDKMIHEDRYRIRLYMRPWILSQREYQSLDHHFVFIWPDLYIYTMLEIGNEIWLDIDTLHHVLHTIHPFFWFAIQIIIFLVNSFCLNIIANCKSPSVAPHIGNSMIEMPTWNKKEGHVWRDTGETFSMALPCALSFGFGFSNNRVCCRENSLNEVLDKICLFSLNLARQNSL